MSSKTAYWTLPVLLFLSVIHSSNCTYENEILDIASEWNMNNIPNIRERMLEEKGEITRNVSDKCSKDIFHFLNGLTTKEPWAIQMFDSYGKQQPGVLEGRWIWPGIYDQCRGVKAPSPDNSAIAFNGKYCLITLPLPGLDKDYRGLDGVNGLNVGFCIPDSCEKDEIVSLLNSAIIPLNITEMRFSYLTSVCHSDDVDFDAKAIIAIVVCSIFLLLMVVGTIYDIKEVQMPKWKREEETSASEINGIHRTVQQLDSESSASEKTPLFCPKEMGKAGRTLLAFSVYTNVSKILSTKQHAGAIHCLDGLRVISLILIITLHVVSYSVVNTGNKNFVIMDLQRRFLYQPLCIALAVDTFFLISGLLRAYLTLKELSKSDGKINWFMYFFHRFWRLSPPYWMVLFLYVSLFPLFGSGPLLPVHGMELEHCSKYWWPNILYINNFFAVPNVCMSWTWYLATDMQLYILSPILILPLFYFDKRGIIVSLLFLLATAITPAVITAVNHLEPGFIIQNARIDLTAGRDFGWEMTFYMEIFDRMGPYVLGILTGYYLYKTKLNVKCTKVTAFLMWCCFAVCVFLPIFVLYIDKQVDEMSNTLRSFYNALARNVWSVGIACLIFVCLAGYGGIVNKFLSWKAFLPFSKLSYCAYLVHPIVIYSHAATLLSPIYWTTFNYIVVVIGITALANASALIVSLMFEIPMTGLEMIYFRKKKTS